MPGQSEGFRDFGILPDGVQPPAASVRSFFSAGRVIGQYIGAAVVLVVGLGLIALIIAIMPRPLAFLAIAAAVMGFGAFLFLATHHDYRWVELDGKTLRAKHLYSGRIVERTVADIESLGTMVYAVRREETVIIERLLGRVRGIEIRFRDGRTPLRIMRADPAMTHAKELIEAVIYRMGELRELAVETVNFNGKPLVRSIYYKRDDRPRVRGNQTSVILVCLVILALLFGSILGFMGAKEQETYVLSSVAPHAISLRALINDGPGSNRHVIVTDFRAGGYAYEGENGRWTSVSIALFPAAAPKAGQQIKAVLLSNSAKDEADVARLLSFRRITGICSKTPRSSWGTVLGPNLVKANPGCTLGSAWEIQELQQPPDKSRIDTILNGSAGCFGVVIVLALLIFWKGSKD